MKTISLRDLQCATSVESYRLGNNSNHAEMFCIQETRERLIPGLPNMTPGYTGLSEPGRCRPCSHPTSCQCEVLFIPFFFKIYHLSRFGIVTYYLTNCRYEIPYFLPPSIPHIKIFTTFQQPCSTEVFYTIGHFQRDSSPWLSFPNLLMLSTLANVIHRSVQNLEKTFVTNWSLLHPIFLSSMHNFGIK